MKFIHAVVYDVTEYENLREHKVNLWNWDELTEGDYIIHCLYDVNNEQVLIHEDNIHQPVEIMIENFLNGVKYANSTNEKIIVKKGGIIVKKSKSPYDSKAVISPLRQLAKCMHWEDK